MTTCPHLTNDICQLASIHADTNVIPPANACAVCTQSMGHVVASLAIHALPKPIPSEKLYLIKHLKPVLHGTGTELKKLISWFPIPKKKNCRSCMGLERRMNNWGPDKCQEKMPYLIKKLSIAARRRNIPFSRTVAVAMIHKAIRNARQHDKQ